MSPQNGKRRSDDGFATEKSVVCWCTTSGPHPLHDHPTFSRVHFMDIQKHAPVVSRGLTVLHVRAG